MKKYLFFPLVAFMLSSCSPKYYESITVADFSEYVEDGFYIYPVGTEVKEKNYIPISDTYKDEFMDFINKRML